MSETLKTVAISAVVAIVVTIGFGMVGGNQSEPNNLGATRFPSGISTASGVTATGALTGGSIVVSGTKDLDNGSATSTFDVGKACMTIIDEAGVSGFLRYTATGFATSSTSCN